MAVILFHSIDNVYSESNLDSGFNNGENVTLQYIKTGVVWAPDINICYNTDFVGSCICNQSIN